MACKRLLSFLLCLSLVACSSNQGLHNEIGDLRRSMDAHGEYLDEVEAAAGALGESWDDVVATYRSAGRNWEEATAARREAREHSDEASVEWRAAEQEYEQAQVEWALARDLVILAAAIDAGNLERFRARGLRNVRTEDLRSCSRVSTSSYRSRLRTEGRALGGLDVDHIVPRSLGGADHPLNYQLLPSSVNRSLGASWGFGKCLGVGLARCAGAIVTSIHCGSYQGGIPPR